jgi:hypothetical protein
VEDRTSLVVQQDKDAAILQRKKQFPEELVVQRQDALAFALHQIGEPVLLGQRPVSTTDVMKVAARLRGQRILSGTIAHAEDRATAELSFHHHFRH